MLDEIRFNPIYILADIRPIININVRLDLFDYQNVFKGNKRSCTTAPKLSASHSTLMWDNIFTVQHENYAIVSIQSWRSFCCVHTLNFISSVFCTRREQHNMSNSHFFVSILQMLLIFTAGCLVSRCRSSFENFIASLEVKQIVIVL